MDSAIQERTSRKDDAPCRNSRAIHQHNSRNSAPWRFEQFGNFPFYDFKSHLSGQQRLHGFAVKSPFDWLNGEKLIYYARAEGAQLRFEDSGSTVFDLESAGVDLTVGARWEILETLRKEFGVHFDDDEVLFHTDWVETPRAGIEAIKFLSFPQSSRALFAAATIKGTESPFSEI